MKKAIRNIDKIDRAACRKETENRFTTEVMAKNHEDLYYKIIKDHYGKNAR
ncbi:MAG: hypothetical protein ABIF89_00905 [bacterium]